MKIHRRAFIRTATTAGLAGFLDPSCINLFAAEADKLPNGLFESPDPAVLKLADEVYQKCILGKIFPAEGPLLHNWIGPGGGYRGQWIWDIADKTVANAIKNGISERYDSMSGKKLGVEYLGMTCTVITMMLDGLCRKHQLKIKTT